LDKRNAVASSFSECKVNNFPRYVKNFTPKMCALKNVRIKFPIPVSGGCMWLYIVFSQLLLPVDVG